jgi:outer membrane protein assembly factor BamB
MTRRLACRCAAVVLALASTDTVAGGDWLRFRGPGGSATSDERNLPATWSAEENLAWKAALPGHGASSPIVVGDRIFLTCFSGYGTDPDKPGKDEDLVRHLVCLRRSDGTIVWKHDVAAAQPEAGFAEFLRVHGYSSSTPTSDGRAVYAFFGKSGVLAFDLEGKELWRADVGRGFSSWGSAASPVLHENLLIVNASLERRSLYGLDKATGKEVWRVKDVNSSWCTPVIATAEDGKPELVLYQHRKIAGFDPATGKELWHCETDLNESYAAPSPVAGKGVVYAYTNGAAALLAIRPGGRGNITKTHVKWRTPGVGSGITSPVLYGDYVYCVANQGIVSCVKAADGSVVYRQRLPGGSAVLYASPLAADGKVYAVSREAGAFVVAAGPEYRLIAHNRIASDSSVFNASVVVHDGQLLLRSNRYLYCIGDKR